MTYCPGAFHAVLAVSTVTLLDTAGWVKLAVVVLTALVTPLPACSVASVPAVAVLAIKSPAAHDSGAVPSWPRITVSVSPTTAVTCTTSNLVRVAWSASVAMNA